MKNVQNDLNLKNDGLDSKKEEAFVTNYNYNIDLYYDVKKNDAKIKSLIKNDTVLEQKISDPDKLNDDLNGKLKENIRRIEELKTQNDNLNRKREEQEENLFKKSYIEIKDLKKNYGDNEVLRGVNLNIKKGERIAIIGHNGSGKSTLTEVISRVKKGTSGTVNYNFAHSKDDFGQKMAIQFQRLNYPEGYKVKEVINFFYKMVPKSRAYKKEEFKQLIKDFGINEFYKKSLTSLSGGQQQRVNLFLTFIKKPSFLILDELSAGLDIDIYEKITKLFLDYIVSHKVTTIVVSHNYKELKYFAEKVFLLKNGILSEELGVENLTENKFFELIKREKNLKTDFKFNFERDKEIKDNIFVKYAKEVRDFYVYWRYPVKTMTEKIKEFHEKRDVLLEELNVLIEDGNVIYTVLKELIDTKSNYSKTKKVFTKKLREQERVQTEIDKLEKKADHYTYLVGDRFALLRLNRLKLLISYQIKYYEFILKSKTKNLNKYKTKHISETEKTKSKIEKLTREVLKYESYVKEKKEFLDKKQDEIKELLQKITKDEYEFKKTHVDMIKVINLKKYFGIKPAINGINLNIQRGERVVITGPNGSGKTTFAEILATTNYKTIGKIKYWFPYKSKDKIKHEIGMQFQEAVFPYDLKVKEILDLFMKVSMWSITKEELDELINIFKIENLLEQKGDVLSGGERQKLNVLIALLKKPSILILDEISTGLDIESVVDINNYIKKYLDETKTTLILISHNPGEAHRLADKVIILKDGIVSDEVDIRDKSEDEIEKLFKDIYIQKNINEISQKEAKEVE